MRITLAQWRSTYQLPTTGVGDEACDACQRESDRALIHQRIILCSYHEGFVDGFDAARGGQ